MSSVIVSDRRGGVFRIQIRFTYGECDRLPYNHLRKINARVEALPQSGVEATAEFNLRHPIEAAHFLEALDLFGEDGAFVHGSAAKPGDLARTAPPDPKAAADADDDDIVIESSRK